MWLLVIGIVALVLHPWRPLQSQFLTEIRAALYYTTLCAAIGIGIVFITQLLLIGSTIFVEESTVRAAENGLAHARSALVLMLPPVAFLVPSVALLILDIVRPQLRHGGAIGRVRRSLCRTLTIVSTIGLFTFFSSQAVGVHQPDWVVPREWPAIRGCAGARTSPPAIQPTELPPMQFLCGLEANGCAHALTPAPPVIHDTRCPARRACLDHRAQSTPARPAKVAFS